MKNMKEEIHASQRNTFYFECATSEMYTDYTIWGRWLCATTQILEIPPLTASNFDLNFEVLRCEVSATLFISSVPPPKTLPSAQFEVADYVPLLRFYWFDL